MLLVALLVAAAVLIALGLRRRRKHRARHRRDAPLPPLLFEVHDEGQRALQPVRLGPRVATPVTPVRPGAQPAAQNDHGDYLPGRFEVVRGRHPGNDIRVRRMPGDTTTVTLGRGEGPRDSHIQLDEETVSRRHARVQVAEGRWSIANLSQTNPILVNGHVLGAGTAALLLADGDTIELGNLVLRFHQS